MKRETITIDEYGEVTIPSDTTDVWMSETELVELFGIVAPTLRAAIKAVYRSEVLKPHEAERYIHLPNGYSLDVYAMPMVVAHAFRINSSSATILRNALLKRMYLRKEKTHLWVLSSRMYDC